MAAVRASTSRRQLVELLLPFMATSSSLVSPSMSTPPANRMYKEPQALSSKATLATDDALKGMNLDGEICAAALRKFTCLPVFPAIKQGESWFSKLKKAYSEGPQMPDLVDAEWRPRDKPHFQQQVVVAALLKRILDVSKVTRRFALASVLHFITRMRYTYLELPAGFDWRFPRKSWERGADEPYEPKEFREYGWPGLVYQVWQRLAGMRHGAGTNAKS